MRGALRCDLATVLLSYIHYMIARAAFKTFSMNIENENVNPCQLAGVFEGATQKDPPAGIGNCPQAGAMYATDLMLTWSDDGGEKRMIPQMLEFNWMPDCERACQYYPEFFNNVFNTLFLDDTDGQNVTLL